MVNVRGRSKGCSTCRKRRVKCDEHRPVCRRCQRWNLDCDGPKDIAFVYATPPRPDSQASKQVSRDAIHILEEKQVPRTISQAVGLEVYICYTQRHLIPHGLIVSAISDMKPVEVLPTDLAKDNRRISHQAILSFVTILFGIQHQQKKIANQGYIMHDVALKQLNQVLSDPSRHTDEEVITAVAALAVAECLVPSGKGNYLKHMMGLQKLIELQEPSAFWPSKPYGYRDGVRFMLLLASWQLKIPCILAKDDWKTAMRINVSPEELQVQDLYDVLADSTVLLATCARIEVAWIPNDPKVEQQRDEMENRGKSLLSQLYAWKRRWDKSFEAKASRTDEHTQPQLITTPCSKGSKEIKLLLYHLVLTCVFHALASLPHITLSRQTILQQSEANKTYLGLTSNYYAIEEHRAALEVCHCIQNYMKERAILDASTSPIVHWAIATVWSKLRYYEGSEGIWLRELLTKKGRQVISNGLWSTYKWLNSLPD